MKNIHYRESSGICFGTCDCKIGEFLKEYPRFIASRSMLVTCIDSSPQPVRLTKWLQIFDRVGVRHETLGDAVWIPESDVARAFDCKGAFVGFDEVYFLKSRPSAVPILAARFTSDGTSFDDGMPDELLRNLTVLGGDRYLADGCGVNFAVTAQDAKLVFENVPTSNG